MNKYKRVKKISQGAFGCVYEYENLKPCQKIPSIVAIKEMYSSPNVRRELQILKDLPEHQNILKIYQIIQEQFNVNVVMEKGQQDLVAFMQSVQYPIDQNIVKLAAKHILQGMKILHSRKYIHRDLKPSNVILKKNGHLALCDFGSAIKNSEGQVQYQIEGFTRWYKAPEMLLGSRKYGYEVDVWSLGCILMQLATGQPYFDAKSQIELLSMISHQLGNPTEKNWPSLSKLPDSGKIQFKPMQPLSIEQICEQRQISPQLSKFIKKMVKYDNRSTVSQLLNDQYLNDINNNNNSTQTIILDPINTKIHQITKKQENKLKKIIKQTLKNI